MGGITEEADQITKTLLVSRKRYYEIFEPLEATGILRRPIVPEGCHHNAHMFYLVLQPGVNRDNVLEKLHNNDIHAVFHYVPLHSSPGELKYGRTRGDMSNPTLNLCN
jgi:dTDP-4-amino-4,6-dideoxygalactose transaminase